jgi:pyruvate/2-oxoglutarate dehydrogenase complex dihydrolipoamide acyltransferase (E2) component
MSENIEIKVPDIGDFENVDVIEVLVNEGDEIKEDDPLVTLETDKAAMDVPATEAGKIKEMKIAAGDKVSKGSVILTLEVAGGGGGEEQEPAEGEQER